MENRQVKVAWCTCNKSILLVAALPYAETDKETVRDFYKLASKGHTVEYMELDTFKASPFMECNCNDKKKKRNA
jgi:hypothetical protein